MDIREGLVEEIILQKGELQHCQMIDYVGIPLRCARCHKYGHIIVECELKFMKKIWVKRLERGILRSKEAKRILQEEKT